MRGYSPHRPSLVSAPAQGSLCLTLDPDAGTAAGPPTQGAHNTAYVTVNKLADGDEGTAPAYRWTKDGRDVGGSDLRETRGGCV